MEHVLEAAAQQVQRILSTPEVLKILGISKPTLYRAMERGDFPRPIKITQNRVGWPDGIIREWQEKKIKAANPT
jgi:prophage regulatory protein